MNQRIFCKALTKVLRLGVSIDRSDRREYRTMPLGIPLVVHDLTVNSMNAILRSHRTTLGAPAKTSLLITLLVPATYSNTKTTIMQLHPFRFLRIDTMISPTSSADSHRRRSGNHFLPTVLTTILTLSLVFQPIKNYVGYFSSSFRIIWPIQSPPGGGSSQSYIPGQNPAHRGPPPTSTPTANSH